MNGSPSHSNRGLHKIACRGLASLEPYFT